MSVSETRSNQWLTRRLRSDALAGESSPSSDHPWLIGSACLLGVFVGLRLMVATFALVGAPDGQAQAARLTENGRGLYKPEYDFYVYLGGCVVSVLAPAGLVWVCHRASRWRTGHDFLPDPLQKAVAWTWLGATVVTAWIGGSLSHSALSAESVPPVVLALAALAVGCVAPVAVCVSGTVRSSAGAAATRWSLKGDGWWFAGTSLLVLLVLAVPDAARLAGRIYEGDRFHHWDHFVMGPALHFHHGRALGTEGYSQYGVGFPLLAEGISSIIPLRYDNLLRMGIGLGCLYFIGLAVLLRTILGNRVWATIGLILALELQAFTGVGPTPSLTLWMCPSSTVLRSVFDVWFFLALWLHLRSGRVRWAVACGIAVGLSLIWVLDTGIYLTVVSLLYVGIRLLAPNIDPVGGRRRALATALAIFGTAAPIALATWYRASRGSFGPEFFGGILEALRGYSGGIGCLPFDSLDGQYVFKFMIVAGTYLFVIARFLVKLVTKANLVCLDGFNACLGAYGLALLLIFIQRTHWCNLSHGIVPFAVLASQGGLAAVRWLSRWTVRPDRAVLTVSGATVLVVAATLVANPNWRAYPGWLQTRWASSETRRVGLGKAVGVKGLSPDRVAHATQFRALTARLATLQRSGQRVAIISDFDPIYCLASGVPPVDRYSPLACHLLTEPLRKCVQKFRETPFDFVCVENGPANPSVLAFRDVLEKDYIVFERYGDCSILRRRNGTGPVGLATARDPAFR